MNFKKLVSLLLALVMTVSVFSTTALAVGEELNETPESIVEEIPEEETEEETEEEAAEEAVEETEETVEIEESEIASLNLGKEEEQVEGQEEPEEKEPLIVRNLNDTTDPVAERTVSYNEIKAALAAQDIAVASNAKFYISTRSGDTTSTLLGSAMSSGSRQLAPDTYTLYLQGRGFGVYSVTVLGTIEIIGVDATISGPDKVVVEYNDIVDGNFAAIEESIKTQFSLEPDKLMDGANVTVQYLAATNSYQKLSFTPSGFTAGTHHKFGYSVVGGELKYNNEETVKVTIKNDAYAVTEEMVITAKVRDPRKECEISAPASITITYGDDLKKAVMGRIQVVDPEESTVVPFTEEQIAITPASLDVALLSTQKVTVSYAGNSTYGAAETDIRVNVRPASAKIDVKNTSVDYDGEQHSPEITLSPDDLETVKVIIGIEGDATGYVSIFLPESLKQLGKIELETGMGDIVDGIVNVAVKLFLGGNDNIYDYIANIINEGGEDGANGLKGLMDAITGIIDFIATPIPIPGVGDVTIAGFLNVDPEMLKQISETIKKVSAATEGFDDLVTIQLERYPINAGIYSVTVIGAELNRVALPDTGYLTIRPSTEGEIKWDNEVEGLYWKNGVYFFDDSFTSDSLAEQDLKNHLAASYYGADGMKNDKVQVNVTYTGTTLSGKVLALSNKVPTEPGVYVETATVFGNQMEAKTRQITIFRARTTIALDDVTVTYGDKFEGVQAPINVRNAGEPAVNWPDSEQLYAPVRYYSMNNLQGGVPTQAGTYRISATFAGDAYYQPALNLDRTLTITRRSLDDEKVTITPNPAELTYTGSYQMPSVTITFENENLGTTETLVQNRDYLIVPARQSTELGDYSFTVVGIGNFKDSASVKYTIVAQDINNTNIIPAQDVLFDGYEHSASSTVVTYRGRTLVEGKDYVIVYYTSNGAEVPSFTKTDAPDLVNVGKVYYRVKGIGNFKGESSGTYGYSINPRNVNPDVNPDMNIITLNDRVYDGESHATVISMSDFGYKNMILDEGVDYEAVVTKNGEAFEGTEIKDVGEYKLTICGKGNYTGEYTKTIVISPVKVNFTWSNTIQVASDASRPHVESDAKMYDAINVMVDYAGREPGTPGEYKACVQLAEGVNPDNYIMSNTQSLFVLAEEDKDIVTEGMQKPESEDCYTLVFSDLTEFNIPADKTVEEVVAEMKAAAKLSAKATNFEVMDVALYVTSGTTGVTARAVGEGRDFQLPVPAALADKKLSNYTFKSYHMDADSCEVEFLGKSLNVHADSFSPFMVVYNVKPAPVPVEVETSAPAVKPVVSPKTGVNG